MKKGTMFIILCFIIVLFFLVIKFYFKESYHEPYALVNSNVAKYYEQKIDKNGIPLLNFKGREIYYPINISQVALHYYKHYYETKNNDSKKYFLKLAQWHLDNFTDNGKWGGWYCEDNLDGSAYSLPSRWISAMSQGFGLSVMIEAYELTSNKEYLKIAEKVINSFEVNVVDGGILSDFGTSVWYEEYPTTPKKHVLNGFIFSLAGIYDYYKYTESKIAKKLFDNGIRALKEHIASFDVGFNSYYSWSENRNIHGIASVTGGKYHHLHIAQLLWVYSVTKDEYFKKWAERFLQQDFGDSLEYGLTKKIKSIEASYTINKETHGVDKLIDKNWSYGDYWSTNKFPTELNIEFNRLIYDLKEIIIVTTKSNLRDTDFEISIILEDGKEVNIPFQLVDKQMYKERHFVSNIQRFRLSSLKMGNSKFKRLKIKFKSYSEKVLAIREINFHYNMNQEINSLLNKFKYERD